MANNNSGFNVLNFYKNLKLVRKIQFGFILIGLVFTAIIVDDYIQIGKLEGAKDAIFDEYVGPRQSIDEVYSEFQKIQFIMLKFSIAEFADQFGSDMEAFQKHKENIDTKLEELKTRDFGEHINSQIGEVSDIWGQYKNVVADAIVSAAVMQSYEMAAVISITSGQEVGTALNEKFDSILTELQNTATTLDQLISDDVNFAKQMIIVGLIIAIAVFLFSTLVLGPSMVRPIFKLKEVVNDYSLGNYETSIEVDSNDEVGELANMMRKLRDAQNEKLIAAQHISEGKFEKVNPASEKDVLAHAFNKEVDIIDDLLHEAEKLIEANQEGNLKLRGDADKFSGSWKKIIEGMNSILDAVVAPIDEAGNVLNSMAGGDFRYKMQGDYKGDYELIKNNVNKVVESLNNVIGQVAQSSSELASSASEISAGTEEMASGANEQNMQATEVASSVEEMTRTIIENTRNATQASSTANEAGDRAKEGGQVVVQTIDGIKRIADVVVKSADTIQGLGKSSDKIGEIVQVINDIADQTNLLALNAAIEAARAGEQGRGFAVVADEVRKLAERTTKATKEIDTMIKEIQSSTKGAVQAIEEGTKEVEKGKELAQSAGDALTGIIANSEDVADVIGQLAAASEEQSATSEQISRNVEAISNVTQQAAQSTQQINHAAENLYRLTNNLQELIGHFKLDNELLNKNQNYLETEEYSVNGNGNLLSN